MKRYLKTFLIAAIAVCMISAAAVFAAGCTDTSKYEITVVTEDGSPVSNLTLQFCDTDNIHCLTGRPDENGKAVFDISKTPDVKEYEIHILVGNYVFADGDELKTVSVDDGYSTTLTVKAKEA